MNSKLRHIRPLSLSIFLLLQFFAHTVTAQVIAADDRISIEKGAGVRIEVLANDVAQNGSLDLKSIELVRKPTNGYINVRSSGAVLYTHDGGASTTDSFTYTVRDNSGARSSEATVQISVAGSGNTPEPKATIKPQPQPQTQLQPQPQLQAEPQPERQKSKESPIVVTTTGSLSAFHRSGQTFLTWTETAASDHYHVYRSASPIAANNLSSAKKLTSRWGPLDSDTSVNKTGGAKAPANHVIDDLGVPLDNSTGLFVYTTQPGDSSSAYYAITLVRNGVEAIAKPIALNSPVTESVQKPQEILTLSVNQGKGRMYTQFMDYSNWNPTFNGYAYNYAVALPFNYNPRRPYPLAINLHAFSADYKFEQQAEYSWEVIQLFPNDPGISTGSIHSWWYGYAADHNYLRDGKIPATGRVENFTEQRIMKAIDEVILNPEINVDEKLIHGYGHSMGASGLLSLAIRYPSIISGVYASQPMTNYASSPMFRSNFEQLWGTQSSNLPIINRGLYSETIKPYGDGSAQSVGVWNWMNHQLQLIERRGDDVAFIMTSHGKQDTVIDWQTQGKPIVSTYTNAAIGFTARYRVKGHSSSGFDSTLIPLFGFGYNDDFIWKYPLDLSFPAIQNTQASSPVSPSDSGEDQYNMDLEWATPHTPFDNNIVDHPDHYEITIRAITSAQRADITPRRTQQFRVSPGARCAWSSIDRNSNQVNGSGTVTADEDSLVTVGGINIVTGTGTRLVIYCQ